MTHHIIQFNRVVISYENIGIVLVRIMILLIVTNLDIWTHNKHVLLRDFFSSKILLQIFTLLGILGKVHSLSRALLQLKVRVIKALLLESFLFFSDKKFLISFVIEVSLLLCHVFIFPSLVIILIIQFKVHVIQIC